jgi:hypothetical protein
MLKGWGSIDSNEVYLVASFNHWFPIKMDKSSKKKVLITNDKRLNPRLKALERLKDHDP